MQKISPFNRPFDDDRSPGAPQFTDQQHTRIPPLPLYNLLYEHLFSFSSRFSIFYPYGTTYRITDDNNNNNIYAFFILVFYYYYSLINVFFKSTYLLSYLYTYVYCNIHLYVMYTRAFIITITMYS